MARTLLVVPTGRRVGLTSTCVGLVTALDRAGVDVGFVKPIAQPRRSGTDQSADLVRMLTRMRPPDPIPADRVAALPDTVADALDPAWLHDLPEAGAAGG